MRKGKGGFYCRHIKRKLDIICALAAMIVFCWLYAIVAILVRIRLGSPVIFKQPRPGKNEKIFTLYKFRTMTDEQDENGKLLSDEIRLTEFGKMLRKTSLDELPEAWNILKGDMSVVGPRPQLFFDLVFMTPEQRKRHTVRQGLTGLAQVSGRNNISWEDKIEWDLKYIENITFLGDCKIIFKTVGKVLKRSDIVRDGTATDMNFGEYLLKSNKISQKEYDSRQRNSMELLEVKQG